MPCIALTLLWHLAQVHLLIDAGADPNLQDVEGNTPLMLASGNVMTGAVIVLLEKGSNPALRNKAGETAENLAERQSRHDVQQVLKHHSTSSIPISPSYTTSFSGSPKTHEQEYGDAAEELMTRVRDDARRDGLTDGPRPATRPTSEL